jgi:hypothetical protein
MIIITYAQARGNDKAALVHLKLKRGLYDTRDRLSASLLSLSEALEVSNIIIITIVFLSHLLVFTLLIINTRIYIAY